MTLSKLAFENIILNIPWTKGGTEIQSFSHLSCDNVCGHTSTSGYSSTKVFNHLCIEEMFNGVNLKITSRTQRVS